MPYLSLVRRFRINSPKKSKEQLTLLHPNIFLGNTTKKNLVRQIIKKNYRY